MMSADLCDDCEEALARFDWFVEGWMGSELAARLCGDCYHARVLRKETHRE